MATNKAQAISEAQQESSGEKRGDKGEIYRIPPINLNTKLDKELIEDLDRMLTSSPFKSHSDLVRQIVRVAVPALVNHPMFSNQAATQCLISQNSTSGDSGASAITSSKATGIEW